MQKIEIRRPTIEDVKEVYEFFWSVITDTFSREGIADLVDDINDEFKSKQQYLTNDLKSDGKERYFLLALENEKIIGSIEYGPTSKLINQCSTGALKDWIEVGTVFVHPDYQRKGIGNRLLQEIIMTLKDKGIEEFCLDSGYKNAQKIWTKKFGQPDFWLKDYWSEGSDHMIWKVNLNDL